MDKLTMTIIVIGLIIFAGLYFYFYRKDKKSIKEALDKKPVPEGTRTLQLSAYERLVILADRIAIPSLVSRSNQPGLDKTEMQLLLTGTIKQEFDHNLSQQIYVSPEAWDAIRNLKEQNIHLINQVSSILPPDTSGIELNRRLLDFVMHQQNGSMHTMVQEALSYEAKKLMH
ncbi:MAG: hypothetical protein JST39_03910 [Bacteroidetes bacterium]|nr:hypothetical protein [Bacteroidota bacterium]